MRRSTDRLYPRPLGPRESQALEIVSERPGIQVFELRDALGVGRARIWQIVEHLEAGHVRRDGEPPADHGPR
jgi:uncharacterized membrane protein